MAQVEEVIEVYFTILTQIETRYDQLLDWDGLSVEDELRHQNVLLDRTFQATIMLSRYRDTYGGQLSGRYLFTLNNLLRRFNSMITRIQNTIHELEEMLPPPPYPFNFRFGSREYKP